MAYTAFCFICLIVFPFHFRADKFQRGNSIPEGVDPELLMKVLGNPEMEALLTSLAKTMKV